MFVYSSPAPVNSRSFEQWVKKPTPTAIQPGHDEKEVEYVIPLHSLTFKQF